MAQPLFIFPIGGFGHSQLSDIIANFAANPASYVVPMPTEFGYKADISDASSRYAFWPRVAIAHSFGAVPVLKLAPLFTGIVLLDPVDCRWFRWSFTLPPNSPPVLWIRRKSWSWGAEQPMNLNGGPAPIVIDTDHNSVPHLPEVISLVNTWVFTLAPAAPPAMASTLDAPGASIGGVA